LSSGSNRVDSVLQVDALVEGDRLVSQRFGELDFECLEILRRVIRQSHSHLLLD